MFSQYNKHLAENMVSNAWAFAIKKISQKRALRALEKSYDLESMPMLCAWFRKKYEGLAVARHAFSEDGMRDLTALLGLVMPGFWGRGLPLPPKLLEGSSLDPNGRFGTYRFSSLGEWLTAPCVRWDDKFTQYFKEMLDDEGVSGGQDDFQLRWELAGEFGEVFTEKLRDLLKLDPAATVVQTVERSAGLRALIEEAAQYPPDLADYLSREVSKLKVEDPFGKLCIKYLTKILDGYEDDVANFRREIVSHYWGVLMSTIQGDAQKKTVEILQAEVSSMLE